MATTTVIFGPGTTPQSGGTISAEVRQTYAMRLLHALDPKLIHNQFCESEPIPKNMGNTIIFRRWERLTQNATPLVEGVTPDGDTPAVTPVTMTAVQYGRWIPITDIASVAMIDKPSTQIIDRQAQQANQTIDGLAATAMSAGTSVQYANGRTSRVTVQAGDNMTAVEMKKAVRTLTLNFAEPFGDGYYVAIIGPNVRYDILAMTEWFTVHSYSQGQYTGLYKGEIGELYGIRFVVSPLAVSFPGAGAAGITVYSTIVFGMNAFLRTEITGLSMQHIVKEMGSAGTADPLDQRATFGWKATYAATRDNELRCVRIESAASA